MYELSYIDEDRKNPPITSCIDEDRSNLAFTPCIDKDGHNPLSTLFVCIDEDSYSLMYELRMY